MGVTKTYNRPKLVETNSTGLDFSLKAAEMPGTPDVFAGGAVGNTGKCDLRVQVDADESGGTDVQDIFKVQTEVILGTGPTAVPQLKVTITPVSGGGVDGTASVFTVDHSQSIDAFQTAAGRNRQA